MQPWLIVIIVIAALICLCFALAALCYKFAFGRRFDRGKLVKYFTAEDFGLRADEISVGKLKGFAYYCSAADGDVVVFAHGMGPGHIAYTTEISCFCKLGYTVIALDSKGCNFSEGKNIGGMYEGVKTCVAAIDYAKENFPSKKIYLVGHSWGGYSVLCASSLRKVDAVAAFSAPSTPVKTLRGGAAAYISKPLAYVLSPFWYLFGFLKYGKNGNMNAVKCARKNKTPTFLIHGDKDVVVSRGNAAFDGTYEKNVTKFLAEGKAHNPYNTFGGEAKLAELQQAISNSAKMTEEERLRYFEDFDYKAATEEDLNVMGLVADFIASA